MAWGEIEVEPEVHQWLMSLSEEDLNHAGFYLDLLEREEVHLGEPYTRHLRGKLRELRFYVDRQQVRITYYIATGRRIMLLTTFPKTRLRERHEIERAIVAIERCIAEGHTVEEEA
jgi:hypothetical protein